VAQIIERIDTMKLIKDLFPVLLLFLFLLSEDWRNQTKKRARVSRVVVWVCVAFALFWECWHGRTRDVIDLVALGAWFAVSALVARLVVILLARVRVIEQMGKKHGPEVTLANEKGAPETVRGWALSWEILGIVVWLGLTAAIMFYSSSSMGTLVDKLEGRLTARQAPAVPVQCTFRNSIIGKGEVFIIKNTTNEYIENIVLDIYKTRFDAQSQVPIKVVPVAEKLAPGDSKEIGWMEAGTNIEKTQFMVIRAKGFSPSRWDVR